MVTRLQLMGCAVHGETDEDKRPEVGNGWSGGGDRSVQPSDQADSHGIRGDRVHRAWLPEARSAHVDSGAPSVAAGSSQLPPVQSSCRTPGFLLRFPSAESAGLPSIAPRAGVEENQARRGRRASTLVGTCRRGRRPSGLKAGAPTDGGESPATTRWSRRFRATKEKPHVSQEKANVGPQDRYRPVARRSSASGQFRITLSCRGTEPASRRIIRNRLPSGETL